jgi:hypothetical protein
LLFKLSLIMHALRLRSDKSMSSLRSARRVFVLSGAAILAS